MNGTMPRKTRTLAFPPTGELRADYAGYTPTTAPGATTIRTADLPRFIAEQKPVVVDPLMDLLGPVNPRRRRTAIRWHWRHCRRRLSGPVGARDGGVDRRGPQQADCCGWLERRTVPRPQLGAAAGRSRLQERAVVFAAAREAWEVAGLPEAEVTPHNLLR